MNSKKKRATAILLLLLSLTACRFPPDREREAKTRAEADTLMVFMRHVLPGYNGLERYVDTRRVLDSLRPIVDENGNPELRALYLRFMGNYYINTQKPDSGKPHFMQALDLARQHNLDPKDRAAAELSLGRIYLADDRIDSALLFVKSAYDFAKENQTESFAKCCLRMAEVYDAAGDVEMERKYLFEGLPTAKEQIRVGIVAGIIGYYDMVGKPDSAMWFFETYRLGDSTEMGPRLRGDIQREYGVRLESIGKYDEALEKYTDALRLYREAGSMYGYIYGYIAGIHQRQKRFGLSNRYLDSAYSIAVAENDPRDKTDILLIRARNAYLQGKGDEAYRLHDSAFQVYKKSVEESFGIQTRDLEAKFEMETKDRKIQALNQAAAAAKRQSQQRNYLIIALFVILLLSAGLVFFMFRRSMLESKLKQTELEQRLLRTQMEPHFIFNTLSVLQSQIRNGENQKGIKYLNKFAKLLRVSLENSREAFVPLAEEVDALENYLSLQAMRFEGAFGFWVNPYAGYRDDSVNIPPMLFQPFVENAIQHGLQNIDRKGFISVDIRKDRNVLHVTITDNGSGLAQHTGNRNKKSLSYLITQERLQALSQQLGHEAFVSLRNRRTEEGPGTVVEMTVPYKG